MASIWMLSKDAMRGMDIVGTISDFLDEYQTKGSAKPKTTDRVITILENIILGAKSYVDSSIKIDSFSMITAEASYTEMEKTPSEFVSVLEGCIQCIRLQKECQNDFLDTLRIIAKNGMQVTSRRVDTKSLILH
jgi:hypothetical protein